MASALPAGARVQDITGPLQASYTWDANGSRQSAHYSQFGGSGNAHSLQRHFSLWPQHNRVQAVQDQWHMASGSVQSEERQLQWDDSGRLMSDGLLSFAYDPHGHIQHISGLGRHTRYQSNALGQRVRKAQDSGTGQTSLTDTVYGEEEMAPGLSSYPLGHYRPGQGGAQALAEYIWLPTAQGPLPVAAEIEGRLYAIHADHLHTPRRLTDTQGRPVWQWVTTAFGEVEATDASSGFTRQRLNTGAPAAAGGTDLKHFSLRYPGQQYDGETGLHYNHHRYYDPHLTVGYTQADPIGMAGGWNRFSYVGGNPLGAVDPGGLQLVPPSVVPPPLVPPPGDLIGRSIYTPVPDLFKPSPLLPTWNWDGITWPNWMESRKPGGVRSDPVTLPPINPGRDCTGECNPCPPGARWFVPRPGHGHENGFWHEIRYNQDPQTCMCYPDRPSRGLKGQ